MQGLIRLLVVAFTVVTLTLVAAVGVSGNGNQGGNGNHGGNGTHESQCENGDDEDDNATPGHENDPCDEQHDSE